MTFQNLRVGTRLGSAIAIILSFMAAMLGGALWQLDHIAAAKQEMAAASYQSKVAEQWLSGIATNGVRTLAKVKSTNAEDEQYYAAEMKAVSAHISELQKELEARIVSGQGKQLLETVSAKRKLYTSLRNEAFRRKAEPGADPAAVHSFVAEQLMPAMKNYIGSVESVVAYQESTFDAANAHIATLDAAARRFMLAIGFVALVASAMCGLLLTRSITRPLARAVDLAERIAAGDLTARVEVNRQDEVGALLGALKRMSENLLTTVVEIRSGTESMVSASQQIAAGNLDLSSRTEQQASSLEETAASMEELTSTVRQNADTAAQAKTLTLETSAVAARGGDAVQKVVATMASISESSNEIGNIIAVIDGIAFQTNILALNAAVEAARAGEQGRGFAVVATEVRNLAQRSAGAAKEIRGLITSTMAKVDDGSRLVAGAGTTMQEIVAGIAQVTQLMAAIATASAEQNLGIGQVNSALAQMDGVTQENASLVEEAAAAAASLHQHATQLAALVSRFQVEAGAAHAERVSGKAQRRASGPADAARLQLR